MGPNVENLMLEHLKRFQATLERLESKQDETLARLGRLELSVAHSDVAAAEHSVRMDGLHVRIERIERRLELSDEQSHSASR